MDFVAARGMVELTLMARQFDRGLAQAMRGIEQFTRRNFVTRLTISAPLAALRNVSSALRAPLALASQLGLDRALGAAAGEAMNLESEMVRLSRVTGLEGRALAAMGEQFKDLIANASGASMEDVFGIAQMGARMGLASGSLRLFTADMVKLRTVMDEQDIPIGEAVTGISRLMQIFGRGAHETLNFASTLLKLDQASTATARDILNISTRLAGPAAMFGLTPQKLMALAAALRDAGVPLETAATATGQILQRMASRKDMPDFARIAGMRTRGFEGLLRADPLGALKAVAKGIEGMDAIAGSRALENLSLDGQRVRMVMLGLAQVLDKLNGLVKTAEEEFASAALIQTFFGKQAGTAAAMVMRLWNNVRLAAAAIGQGLLPVIKGFSEGSISLLTDVRKWFDRNNATFTGWGERVGRALGMVKLVFREWPAMFALAKGYAIDFFEKTVAMAKEAGKQLWANLKVALVNGVAFFKNAMTHVGAVIHAAIFNAIRAVGQNPAINKLIAMISPAAAANFMKAPAAVVPAFDAMKGLRAHPGFDPDAILAPWKNFGQRNDILEAIKQLIAGEKKLADERRKAALAAQAQTAMERAAARARQFIQNLKDAAKRPRRLTAKQLQAQQRAREMAAARQALGIGARGGPMRATAKARAAQQAAKFAREAARKAGRRNRPAPFGIGQPRPPAGPFQAAGPPHLPDMPERVRGMIDAQKRKDAADAQKDQAAKDRAVADRELADAMKTLTRIMAAGGALPSFQGL
jgi:TP901 family phage tail tape measure protein